MTTKRIALVAISVLAGAGLTLLVLALLRPGVLRPKTQVQPLIDGLTDAVSASPPIGTRLTIRPLNFGQNGSFANFGAIVVIDVTDFSTRQPADCQEIAAHYCEGAINAFRAGGLDIGPMRDSLGTYMPFPQADGSWSYGGSGLAQASATRLANGKDGGIAVRASVWDLGRQGHIGPVPVTDNENTTFPPEAVPHRDARIVWVEVFCWGYELKGTGDFSRWEALADQPQAPRTQPAASQPQ